MRLLLVFLLLVTVAWAAPVAMTTDVRGTVKIGKGQARSLLQLEPGETLKLASQARVEVIFFGDGHKESVDGPALVKVEKGRLSGARSVPGSSRSVAAALAGRDFQRYGGDAKRGSQVLSLAPTTPSVVSAGPLKLAWESDAPGPFLVRLGGPLGLDESWASISRAPAIWETSSDGTSLDYAGPPLEVDKTYWWEVSRAADLTTSPNKRGIRLESPAAAARRAAELKSMPSQTYSDHVLRMLLLTRDYRLDEAYAEARRALAVHPADPGLAAFLELLRQDLGLLP